MLQTSAEFDLTDGSPDFSIDLAAVADGLGGFNVTATLLQDGDLPVVLTDTIAATALIGNQFGVRTNPGFNTLEVGVDNLAASVVVPEPTTAAVGMLGLGLLAARRRRH